MIKPRNPPDFKTRYLKSLVNPWVFIVIGLLSYKAVHLPYLWIFIVPFALAFILMNYKAMNQYITNIELEDDVVKITYLNFDQENIIRIPINEMSVNYFSNGKGLSSLVSDHMRIEQKRKTKLKQYRSKGWTIEELRGTTEMLKGLRKARVI